MSAKKEMTKRQRLYYEHNNKDKVKEELAELAKQTREVEDLTQRFTTFDPHRTSYYH
jgi:ATP-dependent Lon protease